MRPAKIPILRKQALDNESQEPQSSGSHLSYSKMVKDLEEAEKEVPNPPYFRSHNLQSPENNIKRSKNQDRNGLKRTLNNDQTIRQKSPDHRDASNHPMNTKSGSSHDKDKKLSLNGIEQSRVYPQINYLGVNNNFGTYKPNIQFGKNIVQSKIENSEQDQEILDHIDEESEILCEKQSDSESSHFLPVSFDDDLENSRKSSRKTIEASKSDQDYTINIKRTAERKSSIRQPKKVETQDAAPQNTNNIAMKSGQRQSKIEGNLVYQHLAPQDYGNSIKLTGSYMQIKKQSIKKQPKQTGAATPDLSKNSKSITKSPVKVIEKVQVVNAVQSSYSEGSSMVLDSQNSSLQKIVLDKVKNVANVVAHLRNKSIQDLQRNDSNQNGISHSYFINKINNLKEEINHLQSQVKQRGHQVDELAFKKKQNRNYHSKSKDKQEDKVQVSFKEYNKQSPSKNNRQNNKNIENQNSQQQDQFHIIDLQVPLIHVIPHRLSSYEALVKMGMSAFQAFNINYKKIRKIDIKKYQDCVQFYVPEKSVLINWEYSGKLYLGSCQIHRSSEFLSKQGEGTQIEPDQYIYKGEFSKNLKNGLGIINYTNGQKYEGEWKKDKYHGKGRLTNTSSKYYGQFLRGKKQGYGRQLFKNGDYYKGQYEDDRFHGKGKYVWKNKTEYVGQFENGFMQGMGQWKTVNGDSYTGQYFQNQKHGQGIYYWKNGKTYKGRFQHGVPVSTKQFSTKNTIPLEHEISYDGNDGRSYEIVNRSDKRMHSSLKRQQKGHFVIHYSKQKSGKSARKYSYQDLQ